MSSDTDPKLDRLLKHLQAIDPNLYVEVCTTSMPREVVVTAEGRRELFPLVDDIVAVAPHVEGWVFVPLKPPMGFDFQTSYEGIIFDP